jgi:L,D-transpeptidase catalytic domain
MKTRELSNELRALMPDTIPRSPRSSLPEPHAHLFDGVRIRVWLTYVLTPLILASSCQRHPQRPAGKWAEVDKTNQVLRAYAGRKLVLESPISTGKEGYATPNGTFAAGEKSRMHHSDLYDNAPMPYSVQISGGYFIHGFSSVPAHPASHGCIRLPMEQAKQFFDWVEPGTPVIVTGKWPGRLTEEGKQARDNLQSPP